MKTMQANFLKRIRITWVIASKDIREAIKNKNTLSVIGAALFIVVIYRLIPGLTSGLHAPELIVYDAGQSQLVSQLEKSPAFELFDYPTRLQMEARVAGSETPYLGLVIPPDFDQKTSAGQAPELQAYAVYWTSPQKAAEIRSYTETELTRLAGTPVRINPELTHVYPEAKENSLGNWAALSLVFVTMSIAIQLIPNLMIEEKNSHTLDALLVSPAGAWEFASGKAIAGLFYVLIGAAVILLSYFALVLHIWPFILAAGLGGLFMVLVGLWVGLKVESRGQLGMFVVILVIPLFLPVIIYQLSDLFSGNIGQVLSWLPSNLMYSLVQTAFGKVPLPSSVLRDSFILSCWVLLAGTGLVWKIKRMDRSLGWNVLAGQKQPATGERNSASMPVPSSSLKITLNGKTTDPDLKAVSSFDWKPNKNLADHPNPLQIMSAIALKDLREAMHNKIVLAILLTSLMMVVVNSVLPLLFKFRPSSVILVVDQGNSSVIRNLRENSSLNIRLLGNQELMEQGITSSMQTSLGLVLPVNFDQRLLNGETILLPSYASHWSDQTKLRTLLDSLNQALSQESTGKVRVDKQIHVVYPGAANFGQPLMISLILVFLLLVMGIALTPVLFVEEKESHTIDALLVSPARPQQIVAGKAVVGITFGLLAASVILIANSYLIVHWEIVLVAVLSSLVFSVALGLFMGANCENPATLGLWGVVVMLLVTIMVFASFFQNPGYPQWLREVLRWLPGSAMLRLVNISMTGTPDLWMVVSSASLLVSVGMIFFFLTVQKVRTWR